MNTDHTNLAIVKAIREQHLSVTDAAKRFNRSRQWIYTLLARYDAHGPAGVLPQPKTPRTNPTRVSEPVRTAIIALRRELTLDGADNGPDTIAYHLKQQGFHPPAESTIRRILTKEGLITPQPQKRPKSSYLRFEAALPNECWQADATSVALADGRRVDILDFLDDHSRYLLYIHAFGSVTGTHVTVAMTELIATFQAPQSTLTDNGMIFTTRLSGGKGGKNGFEKLLADHSIRQKNGRPNHPQTQGKIERFHQTLKHWLGVRPKAKDIRQLQKMLDAFRTWYNTQRPHRAIGKRTPEEVYNDLPKAKPEEFVTDHNRVRNDRVDHAGRITLRWAGQMRYLGIGRRWKGTKTLTIIDNSHAITSEVGTGLVIAEHDLRQDRRYQPNLLTVYPPGEQPPGRKQPGRKP